MVVILADLRAAHVRVVQHARSDDLNRVLSSRVATSHLHVHLRHGTAKGDVSVLLVHVDGIGTGQVSEDDAVVSDGTGLLLENLAGADDLTWILRTLCWRFMWYQNLERASTASLWKTRIL